MGPKGRIVPQTTYGLLSNCGFRLDVRVLRKYYQATSRILGTRVTSVTFTNPIPLSALGQGGGAPAYNIPSLLRRESPEGTNESYHPGRPKPPIQHIESRGARGPEPVHQWWEGRRKRKKSLWTDGIGQLTGKYNGPTKNVNFIWIFDNSRNSAVIKQDSTAYRVNILLKNDL
jgi:hypothetical protein